VPNLTFCRGISSTGIKAKLKNHLAFSLYSMAVSVFFAHSKANHSEIYKHQEIRSFISSNQHELQGIFHHKRFLDLILVDFAIFL
jgi:hypothetical protein